MMKINIENDIQELRSVFDRVSTFCDAREIPEDTKLTLNLIIEEYITNTMIHGCEEHESKNIEIELDIINDEICTTIIDDAREFNPLEADPPDFEHKIKNRIQGGLGVFLINEKAQTKEYDRKDDKNIFKFSLKI